MRQAAGEHTSVHGMGHQRYFLQIQAFQFSVVELESSECGCGRGDSAQLLLIELFFFLLLIILRSCRLTRPNLWASRERLVRQVQMIRLLRSISIQDVRFLRPWQRENWGSSNEKCSPVGTAANQFSH